MLHAILGPPDAKWSLPCVLICLPSPTPKPRRAALRGSAHFLVGLALALTLGLFATSSLRGQEVLRQRRYTELDGLPHSTVHDLAMDRIGRLWVHTGAGVVCFDGESMPLIPRRKITDRARYASSLIPHPDGQMWIVHDRLDIGPRLMDRGRILRSAPLSPSLAIEYDDHTLQDAVGRSHAGRFEIFVATSGPGVLVLDTEIGDWRRAPLPSGGSARALAVDGADVYAWGPFGLAHSRAGAPFELLSAWPHASASKFWTLSADRRGETLRLWATDSMRLDVFEGGEWREVVSTIPVGTDPLHRRLILTPLLDGDLLVAGARSMFRVKSTDGRLLPAGDSSIWPRGANTVIDSGDRIWIGNFRGLIALERVAWRDHPRNEEFFRREVSAIFIDERRTFLGHDDGVTLIDSRGTLTTKRFAERARNNFDAVRVLDVAPDGIGGLWATVNVLGLLHCDAENRMRWWPEEAPRNAGQENEHPETSVLSVLPDGPDSVYVGTFAGVYRVTKLADGWEVDSQIADGRPLFSRRLTRDRQGRLLVGTSNRGVWREEAGRLRRLGAEAGRCRNVYAFARLPGGEIIAGGDDGLYEVRGDRLLPYRSGAFQLLDQPVYSLLSPGDGDLFVGTQQGVVWVHDGLSKRYTVEHGLSGQEVNRAALVRAADGRIYVGTNGGLSILDPLDFRPDEQPRLRLDSMRSNEGPLDMSNRDIVLPLGSAGISFTLSTLSFESRSAFRYRYRLYGLHDDWVEPTGPFDGTLDFPRLEAGTYCLAAQVRRPGGPWSASTLSPDVTVRQPLWRNGWFLAGLFVGIVLITWALQMLLSSRVHNQRLSKTLREREKELARRELLYTDAFQRHSVAQLMLEPATGRITDLNRAARVLLGIKGSESSALQLEDFVGMSAQRITHLLRRCFDENRLDRIHLLVGEADERKTLEALVSPLRLENRECVQAVLLDVTDRHRLEEELREAYKQLAVGRVTRGMAHDFNNLLQIIGGNSELALDSSAPLSPHLREELEEIQQASQRGSHLVRRLADLGRESATADVSYRLDAALEESRDEIDRALLARPDIRLDVDFSVADAGLVGDQGAFRSTLVELVTNARDALPAESEGRISIRAFRRQENEVARVIVEVTDNGPGFDPDSLNRVREPFFTTKDVGAGRGLGLAEVNRFASRMGGRLILENLAGGGARARLDLPTRDLSRREADNTHSRGSGPRGVLFVGRPGADRSFLREELRARACPVFEAQDGPEALRLFSHLSHEIRVLVLAEDLQGLDPDDLARVLRSERASLEVTRERQLLAALRSGAEDFPAPRV
jgi:signal transduction histidine kinase